MASRLRLVPAVSTAIPEGPCEISGCQKMNAQSDCDNLEVVAFSTNCARKGGASSPASPTRTATSRNGTMRLRGRLTEKTYPDSTTLTYTYEDTTSRLKSVLDALGKRSSTATSSTIA